MRTLTTGRCPAGRRIKLTIVNQDPAAEEFESYELHREKLIPANSSGTVYIGPLEAVLADRKAEFGVRGKTNGGQKEQNDEEAAHDG